MIGKIPNCVQYHPNGKHLVFSLGATVVIQNLEAKEQIFLRGHTDKITCFTISRDGKYIASGQSTHMGFIAPVKVWDFERAVANNGKTSEGECIYTLQLHKVKIQGLAFSPSGEFLTTLGGQDDNNVVVWNMKK